MEIKLIGTGSIGAVQSSASTLINKEILIDMPNGIVKRIKQLGEDVLNIKAILITHLHGDHFFDIPFFILEKYFNKVKEETNIYCPKGSKSKVKQLFDIAFPGDYEKVMAVVNVKFIEFEELKKQKLLDKYDIDSIVVEHGNLRPAYGYIIKENTKTIGFSGDSRMCEAIEYIVKESNISVLDMSLAENGNNAHMGLNDIEKICTENKEKTIISTHMHDYTRETANTKNIKNLIIPEDGQIINI